MDILNSTNVVKRKKGSDLTFHSFVANEHYRYNTHHLETIDMGVIDDVSELGDILVSKIGHDISIETKTILVKIIIENMLISVFMADAYDAMLLVDFLEGEFDMLDIPIDTQKHLMNTLIYTEDNGFTALAMIVEELVKRNSDKNAMFGGWINNELSFQFILYYDDNITPPQEMEDE